MDGGIMNEDKCLAVLSYGAIAAAFCILSAFFLTAGMDRVLTVIPDDAAYYFKIADKVSAGRGLTFDGINRTNGFQPLWLYLLVPVFAAYRGTPEEMCRIVLVLQLLLLGCAALLLNSLLARYFSRRVVFASLVLFLFLVSVPAANGMESAILVCSLTGLLAYGSRAAALSRRDVKREFVLGVLLGLVVLSRLDMVFVPVVVLAFTFGSALRARGERRARLTRAAAILAGTAVIVAPYLIFNRASFGAMMPISGMLKSSFPEISSPRYALSTLGKRGWIGAISAIGYLIWYVARSRSAGGDRSGRSYFRRGMAVMAVAILLHLAHALLFMKWAVFSWHYVPYMLFAVVVLCEPAERVLATDIAKGLRSFYWPAVAAVAVAGCLNVFGNLSRDPGRSWGAAAYEAARWARAHSSPDDVFAMKDAGNFGYFSERRVINLDGVVNNLEYQAALEERNLKGYLSIKGVRFIAQHAFWDRPDITSGKYDSYTMTYEGHRYRCRSEEVTLRKADEAYRSRPYFDGPYETVFIIWRIRYGA
jgi:hypothetical protein